MGTLLVARILTPADIGLLTVATMFLSVVAMLSEFGIGTAVISLRELDDRTLGSLHSFSAILGLGGTLLTVALAYPLGAFFHSPLLPPVLMVVGTNFLLNSIQTVPAAMLRRDLKFKQVAIIDTIRGLTVPVVTLVGALLGMRYWALALGSVCGALLTSFLTNAARPMSFRKPRVAGLSHILHYSKHILVGRIAWVVYQDGDFAVAGRRLPIGSVGVYGMAWTLATAPLEKIVTILADVVPTLFSAAQNDRAVLRRYFLNLSEILCLVTFPVACGIALISSDLVAIALGPKWAAAAAPLALLALYAGARSVTTLFGHLFNVVGETRFAMWSSIALAIALLTGFVVGSHWGPAGIAAAWVVVHPPFSAYSFTRVSRALGITGAEYLKALRLGLSGSIAMAAALLTLQHTVAASWTPGMRLAAEIPLGAAVFGGTTFVLYRQRLKDIVAWFKRVRRSGNSD
jgi:PST family polysaccharide transporter